MLFSEGFFTVPVRQFIEFWKKPSLWAAVSAWWMACSSTGGVLSLTPSYDLAHNTERSSIMNETTQILNLYNFIIESSDLRRDRGALQTFWRTNEGRTAVNDSERVVLRDRVFLHISPRGKSSIQYNTYQMVNATIEFEVQMNRGGSWVDVKPFKEFEDQYKAIVRDIRNRMLRYQIEF